jgi:hypothetical protein
MSDTEEIEAEEPVENLLLQWYRATAALREIANSVHQLIAELPPHRAEQSTEDMRYAVEQFLAIAGAAQSEAFWSLHLATARLHNRGVEVLHPDKTPVPVASPFVRQMPEDQADIEAKRHMRQGRHVSAYESHIIASMEHFRQAWLAMLDGALICDPEMTEDEFPKLAILATEVRKAYGIWSSVDLSPFASGGTCGAASLWKDRTQTTFSDLAALDGKERVHVNVGRILTVWRAIASRSWGSFMICRLILARRGDLPRLLMAFLRKAYERSVLPKKV